MFFSQQDNFLVKLLEFEYDQKLNFITQILEIGEFEVVNHNIKKGKLAEDESLLLTVIKGQGIVFDNENELALISGDVYHLDSGSDYLISNNNWSLMYVLIKGGEVDRLLKSTIKKYEFDVQSRIKFDKLYEALVVLAKNNSDVVKISAELLIFLSDFMTKEQEISDRKTELIRESILYIENHYKESITLDELAQHVGYSKFYFSRLFKEYLGLSFIDYLHKRRILEAIKLLDTTNLTVNSILHEVGYNYEANFYKYFNKYFKMSPNDYRLKQIKDRKNY